MGKAIATLSSLNTRLMVTGTTRFQFVMHARIATTFAAIMIVRDVHQRS
jgi:hypothetical protein